MWYPRAMKNEATIGGIVVAGQLTDDELRGLEPLRFASVVNVRMPEELEEPEGPKIPAGVAYREVGFTGATLRREHVEQVRAAVDAAAGPVLIH